MKPTSNYRYLGNTVVIAFLGACSKSPIANVGFNLDINRRIVSNTAVWSFSDFLNIKTC